MKASYFLLGPALLALNGCVIEGSRSGPVQYSSDSVEMDDSEAVRVDLRMGAGDLRVTPNGAVTTASGLPVMSESGPLNIPPSTVVNIGSDGTVSVVPLTS